MEIRRIPIPEVFVKRAPNRLLDLDELQHPEFRAPVVEMASICARQSVSYLHPSKQWEYPWALERAALRPGERILDAGCGASVFPLWLASQGVRVSACDLFVPVSLDSLHGVEVDYVRADLRALPFETGAFDAVFCVSVIEHLPLDEIPCALAELRRILRPGARLLLTTDYCRDAEEEMWYEGDGEPFRVDWSVFDEKRLRRFILQAEGFTVDGEVDLSVDWDDVRPAMRRFHGYPYTSVGIGLVKTGE